DPETVKRLYKTAIDCGARAIVVCDTCGHATPNGVAALVRYVIDEIVKPSGEQIRVDWHGHCDRGLAVANSLAALAAGAECHHTTLGWSRSSRSAQCRASRMWCSGWSGMA